MERSLRSIPLAGQTSLPLVDKQLNPTSVRGLAQGHLRSKQVSRTYIRSSIFASFLPHFFAFCFFPFEILNSTFQIPNLSAIADS